MTTRKLLTGIVLAALLTVGFGASVLPASAQPESVTVTLLSGRQITTVVDLPPGGSLSGLRLPGISEPIVKLTDNGPAGGSSSSTPAPASTPTAPPTPLPPRLPTPKPTGPATVSPGSPAPADSQRAQKTTGSRKAKSKAKVKGKNGSGAKTAAPVPQPTVPAKLPSAANPTLSFALPNPAAIGVPDFFIQKFRVPLFLLPIYQAAGTEYGVPWQVLAAINEIESDYGRDLAVSSAGAEGWMQFLPSTWKVYGVDANQDGKKDPYNPADAIFAAARYLKAAGAEKDLRGAVFAYNHATWYVDSVMLRAKLIGGMPDRLIGSLTGLTQGHFPVSAKARYADDAAAAKASKGKPKMPMGVNIFSRSGAAVVAVQDAKIVRVGVSKSLGNFVSLQDAYGNLYTYSGLKRVASTYPVPKPAHVSPAQVAKQLHLAPTSTADPKPSAPASAGHQSVAPAPQGAATPASTASATTAAPVAPDGATKERLYASPSRPGALVSAGRSQLDQRGQALPSENSFSPYFTQAFGLGRSDVVLKPLRKGASVIAGTVIGRIGQVSPGVSPHVLFQVRPAGRGAPLVDPKPILDGWKLLESTAIYRAANKNPFLGPDAKNPTVGQVFLLSKEALGQRVLADPNVSVYDCGRRDIEAGAIDRRVLATLEFLSASGLKPAISALKCGHSLLTTSGNVSEHSSGDAVDIAQVNGIPILGHQGPGSITDITIRRLLTMQGIFKPHQIISLMTYPGTDNTLAMPDHANHIHLGFAPLYSTDPRLAAKVDSVLKPDQWIKLIDRLRQIKNPIVSSAPSRAAIPAAGTNSGD